MELQREDLAWAAGFFDGEGCVSFGVRRGRYKTRQIQVNVTQSGDHAVTLLSKFQCAVANLGHISGPFSGRRTPRWNWGVTRFESVQAVIAMLWPWLGPAKRNKAKLCLSAYRDHKGVSSR